MIRAGVAAALALAATAFAAAPTLAQLKGPAGCLAPRAAGCTSTGFAAPFASVASADGRSVYAVGGVGSNGFLVAYRRVAASGALVRLPGKRSCLHVYRGSASCTAVRALETPTGIVVSADGRFVYVAAGSNGAVTTFRRLADGSLRQPAGTAACVSGFGGPCAHAPALEHPVSVAIAPDGRTVYAVGNSTIVVLARNATTGRLVEAGCVNRLGTRGCDRLTASSRRSLYRGTLTMSADGRSLYAASGDALYAFGRDAATGALTETACFAAVAAGGCTVLPGIGAAASVAVSADGTRVYAAGGSRSVATLARDPSTGALTALAPLTVPFRALSLAKAGRLVAVGGDRGVATIAAGAVRGTLGRVRGPRGPYAVSGSRDGRSVYVTGTGGVAVLATR